MKRSKQQKQFADHAKSHRGWAVEFRKIALEDSNPADAAYHRALADKHDRIAEADEAVANEVPYAYAE